MSAPGEVPEGLTPAAEIAFLKRCSEEGRIPLGLSSRRSIAARIIHLRKVQKRQPWWPAIAEEKSGGDL